MWNFGLPSLLRLENFSKEKSNDKLVKISSVDVPEGILPEGVRAELTDLKAGVRGRPDDVVYNKHKDIQELVRWPAGLILTSTECIIATVHCVYYLLCWCLLSAATYQWVDVILYLQ